jgi:hypothetical protein
MTLVYIHILFRKRAAVTSLAFIPPQISKMHPRGDVTCTLTAETSDMVYSAGILVFTIRNGEVYLLLGRDRSDNSFSDFGGRQEDIDGNDPKVTAAREFFEESAGQLIDQDEVMARLSDPACHVTVMSRTMGLSVYHMFCMYIPYVSHYTSSFAKSAKFLRAIKCHRIHREEFD